MRGSGEWRRVACPICPVSTSKRVGSRAGVRGWGVHRDGHRYPCEELRQSQLGRGWAIPTGKMGGYSSRDEGWAFRQGRTVGIKAAVRSLKRGLRLSTDECGRWVWGPGLAKGLGEQQTPGHFIQKLPEWWRIGTQPIARSDLGVSSVVSGPAAGPAADPRACRVEVALGSPPVCRAGGRPGALGGWRAQVAGGTRSWSYKRAVRGKHDRRASKTDFALSPCHTPRHNLIICNSNRCVHQALVGVS